MGKEQRNEKMSKKPKKDTSPPKPSSSLLGAASACAR